jgi:ferric-dicitrate binding protein FerR (iron transport regulator)
MKPEGSAPFSFRLSPTHRAALEARAKELGIPAAELVRGWVLAALADPLPLPDRLRADLLAVAAVVIAALSADLDLEDATVLLADHLTKAGAAP